MIPQYPKFKPLEIEDKDLISHHLNLFPRKICELALANFFIWKAFDRSSFTFINQNLCILINSPVEPPYFLEPLGQSKLVETVDICLKHAGKISRASESFVSLLPQNQYQIACQRSQYDYVYLTQDLAELKGRKFDGKRNHIKRFKRHFPDYQFIPIGPGYKTEALELFEKWFAKREESRYFPKLAHTAQKNALARAFANFEKLRLIGSALIADDKLKGFTLGSRLNPETASVHFLYADPQSPGSSQMLLWEACDKTYSKSKYLNLEQDLGIPGLRQAKLSYHPLKLEEKYEIKPSQQLLGLQK